MAASFAGNENAKTENVILSSTRVRTLKLFQQKNEEKKIQKQTKLN